mmetsp:Transcript_7797/g.14964  ORF Transcript_7797/g.14964 Transcript_7797/m.14964 type:complete len:87 (+) Transcript_7797:498-758(+)
MAEGKGTTPGGQRGAGGGKTGNMSTTQHLTAPATSHRVTPHHRTPHTSTTGHHNQDRKYRTIYRRHAPTTFAWIRLWAKHRQVPQT